MTSAAVIVGVNAYTSKPLTSAVNDADEFRKALIKYGLVGEKEIQMFTSPALAGTQEATKKKIKDALYDFYVNGDDLDRFFFFFAGHGLLTFSNVAQGATRTVLLPSDVQDLDRDGDSLIDLAELQSYLRHGGPQQQCYIIDACRNLEAQSHPPSVGTLGWKGRVPLGAARAQSTLYAVSELGEARGVREGLGVVTGHVIEALKGEGVAKDYDNESQKWVVSMRSLSDYVKDAVAQGLINEPAYLRRYLMPQFDGPDPQTDPLRELGAVGDESLTVKIKPSQAAPDTSVTLSLRSFPLKDYGLPPQKNGATFSLPPQQYLVEAVYRPDRSIVPVPNRRTIDLRKDHDLEIIVPLSGPSPSPSDGPDTGPDTGPPEPNVSIEGFAAEASFSVRESLSVMDLVAVAASAPPGRITATALEPEVVIEVDSLQPPYKKWSGNRNLDIEVPTGNYELRFRLGINVFNRTTVYVKAGQTMNVSPTVDAGSIVREALDLQAGLPEDAVISESIGPIQAGLLQTMLPLIGVKPFDTRNEILGQFTNLVAPRDPKLFQMHPLSVVIALDGNKWGETPAADVLQRIRCRTEVHTHAYEPATDAGFSFAPIQELQLEPLARATLRDDLAALPEGGGFGRIRLAVSSAPAPSFMLVISSPELGNFSLACAAIDGRATVVSVTFRPDGSVDVSQNILRLPNRPDLYTQELVPDLPYGRMVRELQLGQQLYRSGELVEQKFSGSLSKALTNLLYAKWTDPILSCMGFLAWQRYDQTPSHSEVLPLLRETATNLERYFSGLPDTWIVYGLAFPEERVVVFDSLLRWDRVPVLAESVRILAGYAEEAGRPDAPVVLFARRMSVGQSWAQGFRMDEELTPHIGAASWAAVTQKSATASALDENEDEETSTAGA